jgi:acyl-CoA oxidase
MCVTWLQVIEYRTQQSKLFPLLATVYAYRAIGFWMESLYADLMERLKKNDFSTMPEAHACTAGLKSIATSTTAVSFVLRTLHFKFVRKHVLFVMNERSRVDENALRALLFEFMQDGIEECRKLCGGHGYLCASGLPELYAVYLPTCTYEGDNKILLLQVPPLLPVYLNFAYCRKLTTLAVLQWVPRNVATLLCAQLSLTWWFLVVKTYPQQC